MAKLFRAKNLAVLVMLFLLVLCLFYFKNFYESTVNLYVPVSRNNLFLKDANVDISIQRVDELHLHQDQINADAVVVEGGADVNVVVDNPVAADPVAAKNVDSNSRNESDLGELPVQDMHDGQRMFDSSMRGYLNYDVWHWIVGYLVDDMRIIREFPLYPDERKKIDNLHLEFNEVDPADVRGRYSHKIYGYIIPPEPGAYTFKVELTQMTAASSVELWLSTDSDPFSISKVLDFVYDDMSRAPRRVATSKTKESIEVSMESSVHYFEFLEKAFEGKITTKVLWKTPSSDHFTAIPSHCFAMALKLSSNGSLLDGPATHLLHGPLSSNQLQSHHLAYAVSDTIYPITPLDVLPSCEYKSLYAKPHKIKPYQGVYEVRESYVEPKDDTWYKHWRKNDKGNPTIKPEIINSVMSLYKSALNASKTVHGTVTALRSLEQTPNKEDGSRFLLELDIQLHKPAEETVHTSEYVYLKKGSNILCHTSNFQWTKNVDVHFVVSVKNLGMWVRHLIYNMEDIYAQTNDEHFSLIIVDYESEDMDIEQEAKKSSFKRIKVMHLKGGFSRSGGLQAGINSVEDKNSIVMTIDMHLTLPTGIVEYARRHTVQYKMAFTPMFFRLNKGYTEVNYNGFWETLTYGLFSMYKNDWVTFGGFNTKKFKTKWGGEDWDIVDRSLAKGFEAFRIRPPGLVHYHHTRKGMWGNKEIKFSKSWSLH